MLDKIGYYFCHNSGYKKLVGGLEWCVLEWTGEFLFAPGNEIPIGKVQFDDFVFIELPKSKLPI